MKSKENRGRFSNGIKHQVLFITARMESEDSGQTASPPKEPLGKWESSMADNFGLYCAKVFLKRDLEKTGTSVDESAAKSEVYNDLDPKMEVLEKVDNGKFSRFLNSEEYEASGRYFGLRMV